MSSPALALTPVPPGSDTTAGATTGTIQPTATVITRCVRTRLENRENGELGRFAGPSMVGSALLPLSFHRPSRPPASGRAARD